MTSHHFPFSLLNLRYNPFGELTPRERVELAHVDIDNLINLMGIPGTAVLFLAPHGYGKTTRLLKLHSKIPEGNYVRFAEYLEPEPKAVPILFCDSIDLLEKRRRKRLLKEVGSFACTTHVNLSQEFNRMGYR
jgi:hypothetical protein